MSAVTASGAAEDRGQAWRAAVRSAAVLGAIGSIGLMLWVGRRNPSWLLLAMFAAWVTAPFALLLWAETRLADRWPGPTRFTLRVLMIAISLGTLSAYASVPLRPNVAQPAFLFLVVPPASLVIAAVCLGLAALIAARTR